MTLADLINVSKEYELDLAIVTSSNNLVKGYVVSGISMSMINEVVIDEICIRNRKLRYPVSDTIVPLAKIDHVAVSGDLDM